MRKLLVFLPALIVIAAFGYWNGTWETIRRDWAASPQVHITQVAAAIPAPPPSLAKAPPAPAPKDENELLLEKGRQAAQAGRANEAAGVFADLMRRFPASPIGGRAAVEMALLYNKAGDFVSERNTLSQAIDSLGEGQTREQVVEELNRLNGELIFSKKPTPDSITYTVKKGDSLFKIAAQYRITPQFIKRINYLSSDRIGAGEELKLFQGPFDVVVEKAKFRLTVYRAGIFVKEYKVGLGKNGSTPVGEFIVRNKLIDPVWDPPGPEYAASKAPDNPLGTRWIGFDGEYGIHGTIEPDSIGKSESRGCVRLLNQDVEEIYDLVIIGSKVTVKK